jgi:hypothetical protein
MVISSEIMSRIIVPNPARGCETGVVYHTNGGFVQDSHDGRGFSRKIGRAFAPIRFQVSLAHIGADIFLFPPPDCLYLIAVKGYRTIPVAPHVFVVHDVDTR